MDVRRMGVSGYRSRRNEMAKYIFLQYVDESKVPPPGSPEMQGVIDAFARYLEELKAAGAFHDGDPCQPSSAGFSVSVRDGHAKTTEGPMYAQSPWLNGYFVLNCKDDADAAAWAARNPAAYAGTVEVHPILLLS
jgi:hypothetical protein